MHNATAAPIPTRHSDLERESESAYRSTCPKCPIGILFIRRDNRGVLVREDACVACAQQFVYTDDTINNEPLVAAKDGSFEPTSACPARSRSQPQLDREVTCLPHESMGQIVWSALAVGEVGYSLTPKGEFLQIGAIHICKHCSVLYWV